MALPPSLEVQFSELLARLKDVARRLRIGHPRPLRLIAESGAVLTEGVSAELEKNTPTRSLPALANAYAVSGVAATLTYTPTAVVNRTLTADRGIYAVTGVAQAFNTSVQFATIPQIDFVLGSEATFSVAPYITDLDNDAYTINLDSTSAAMPTGVAFDATNLRFTYTGGGSAGTTSNVVLSSGTGNTAQTDWATRIAGSGVVWYHAFESDSEINKFRWSGLALPGGNDPNASTADAGYMTRLPTSGPGGMPCLQILRPANRESDTNWWRPFSAIATPGNGRITSDPGAGKTVRTWSPTQNGNETQLWGQDFYGPQTYQEDYYVQIRVKRDPRRVSPSYNAVQSVGKQVFLTCTVRTLTDQEIVTYSGSGGGSGGTTNDFMRVYVAGSPPIEQQDPLGRPGQQVGGELSVYNSSYCDVTQNPGKCWSFSGGWDTLLYHVTPGAQTSGTVTSTLQVYAAREGVTTYTKIYDTQFTHNWYDGSNKGWNAICLNTYNNNANNFPGEFWQRYAQIIFSTDVIPCPQV